MQCHVWIAAFTRCLMRIDFYQIWEADRMLIGKLSEVMCTNSRWAWMRDGCLNILPGLDLESRSWFISRSMEVVSAARTARYDYGRLKLRKRWIRGILGALGSCRTHWITFSMSDSSNSMVEPWCRAKTVFKVYNYLCRCAWYGSCSA